MEQSLGYAAAVGTIVMDELASVCGRAEVRFTGVRTDLGIVENNTAIVKDRVRILGDTGGEGLWKRVFTCWEHFRLWQKVLPMFLPDTFHSHFKCNVNICFQCDC